MVFNINPGEFLRVTVNWTNIGSTTHDFIVRAYYGKIICDETGCHIEYYDKAETQELSVSPNETRDTNCDFPHPIPRELSGQDLDVLVEIEDPERHTILDQYPDFKAIHVA